jgi:hypothetical protein
MVINTNELENISNIRKRLESCLLKLYSLSAMAMLQSPNFSQSDKEDFVKKRENLSLCVSEFRNKELEIIANWLRSAQKPLLTGITNLENEIEDFNDLANTISAIAEVVGIITGLITGLPIP